MNIQIYRNLKKNDVLFEQLRNTLFLDSSTLTYLLSEVTNRELLALVNNPERRIILEIIAKYKNKQ